MTTKTAGFFSWECKGCNKSLLSPMACRGTPFAWLSAVVVVQKNGYTLDGTYDGYGGLSEVDDDDLSLADSAFSPNGPSLWHQACWKAAGRPRWNGPSKDARDQGWFFDEADYLDVKPNEPSAGTKSPFHGVRAARVAARFLVGSSYCRTNE